MTVVACLVEVEMAVVAIKTSASPPIGLFTIIITKRNMMAILCILKYDYDVRPKICRGTYVAINKLITKTYKNNI